MSEPEKELEDEKDNTFKTMAVATCIVLILFGVGCTPLIWYCVPATANNLGDFFGFTNAIFSGFAFAGLIVTMWMQREELRLQRIALRETREEMRRSADAQAASERRLAASAALSALESLREELLERTIETDGDLESAEAFVLKNKIELGILQYLRELGLEDQRSIEGTTQWMAERLLLILKTANRILLANDADEAGKFVNNELKLLLEQLAEEDTELRKIFSRIRGGIEAFNSVYQVWKRPTKSTRGAGTDVLTEFEIEIIRNLADTVATLAKMGRTNIDKWNYLFSK